MAFSDAWKPGNFEFPRSRIGGDRRIPSNAGSERWDLGGRGSVSVAPVGREWGGQGIDITFSRVLNLLGIAILRDALPLTPRDARHARQSPRFKEQWAVSRLGWAEVTFRSVVLTWSETRKPVILYRVRGPHEHNAYRARSNGRSNPT